MFSKTILIGHVGQDPKITEHNERKLASFSLATRRVWFRNKEKQEETTWHRINVVNSNVASVVERFVKKGNLLTVEGRIQKREYEKDGETKESYEILVDFDGSIQLMPRSTNGGSESSGGNSNGQVASKDSEPPQDFDDDIPF